MKEIDLGHTYPEPEQAMAVPEKEPEVCYPTLWVNGMKESDGKDVGEEFYAKVKLCKKSITKTKKGYDCEYEVKSMAPIPTKKEMKSFSDMLDDEMEG
jgi:hypothetical protein